MSINYQSQETNPFWQRFKGNRVLANVRFFSCMFLNYWNYSNAPYSLMWHLIGWAVVKISKCKKKNKKWFLSFFAYKIATNCPVHSTSYKVRLTFFQGIKIENNTFWFYCFLLHVREINNGACSKQILENKSTLQCQ